MLSRKFCTILNFLEIHDFDARGGQEVAVNDTAIDEVYHGTGPCLQRYNCLVTT